MEDKEEKQRLDAKEGGDSLRGRDSPERGDSGGSGQTASQGGPKEQHSDSKASKDELLGPEIVGKALDGETVIEDPFSDDNWRKVVYVQLQRLYDLQLAFLTMADKEFAGYVASLHSNGEFFGPDPSIRLDS